MLPSLRRLRTGLDFWIMCPCVCRSTCRTDPCFQSSSSTRGQPKQRTVSVLTDEGAADREAEPPCYTLINNEPKQTSTCVLLAPPPLCAPLKPLMLLSGSPARRDPLTPNDGRASLGSSAPAPPPWWGASQAARHQHGRARTSTLVAPACAAQDGCLGSCWKDSLSCD